MTGAIAVAVLTGTGVFLLLQRSLIRITLGFILLGHAANVFLLLAGGTQRRGIPIEGKVGPAADPLPQAFVLTAIVISFGITAFLVALSYRKSAVSGDDDLGSEDRGSRT